MVQLDLTLFGGFHVAVAQTSVTTFRTDKMRALLAYLAMNAERPFRRDMLATLLWSEWSDQDARRNLRQTLYRLCQTLDEHTPSLSNTLLTTTRQTVQLHKAAVTLDVAQFQQHLQACEEHHHRQLNQCEFCINHMQQAEALYQGDLLAGFNLKDALPFDEWLMIQREQLQQQMLRLLDKLAHLFEEQGDYEQAEHYAHKQVRFAPWQESAHRLLMRLLMQQNRRSEALAQYEICCQHLEEELGVSPASETVQLWQQIKNNSFTLSPPSPSRLYGFPTQLTPFIGRQKEIEQIVNQLSDEECRLLTLIGPGGMGKTRLSLRVGQEMGAKPSRYHDGIYFVPLITITHEDALIATLAQHLGIQLVGQRTTREKLLSNLQDKELLLICDNFEQLMDSASVLGDIVEQAPGVQILVTSRQPLQLQAEWRQTLSGLDYLAGESSEAVRFFQRCAQRVSPQFRLSETDTTAVMDLCRLVDGLPLALELAAAWTRMMDCDTILHQTRKSLDFLTTSLEDLPERHQSIRAVLTQSWQMLPSRLQTILSHLSQFAGSFTMEAALAIVPDLSLLDIATLLDKSLLHWQADGRYQMHELLRQFAQEKVVEQHEIVRRQYAQYYLYHVADLEAQLKSPKAKQVIADFQQEINHVRQAWQWAVALSEWELIAAALNGLMAYHEFRGTFSEGHRQFMAAAESLPSSILLNRLLLAQARCLEALGELTEAIALMKRVVETVVEETRLPALIRLGRLYERTSQYDVAITTLEEVLALADGLSAEAEQTWNILGLIYRYRGRVQESIDAHQKALMICHALEDELEIAETHANLSLSYKEIADYDTAVAHIEKALTIARRLNHQEKICGFTHSLGVLYWQQDKLEQAKECWLQSLELAEQMNFKRLITICCNGLGVIALRHHLYEEGLRYLRRALLLAKQLGDKFLEAIMLGSIGIIHRNLGEYEAAINYFLQGAVIDRSTGAMSGVGRHLGNVGDTLIEQERYAEALPYFEEAILYMRQTTATYYLCWTLVSYATCLFEVGRLEEAQKANEEGGRLAEEIQRDIYVLLSHLLKARLQAQTGDQREAVAQLDTLRERYPTPEMRAEIEYTLWQITGDTEVREVVEAQFEDLYQETRVMTYQNRLRILSNGSNLG